MSINTKLSTKPVTASVETTPITAKPRLIDRSIKNKGQLKKHQLAHQKKLQLQAQTERKLQLQREKKLQVQKEKKLQLQKERKAKKRKQKAKMKTPQKQMALPKSRIKKSEASELRRHMFIFRTLSKSGKRTDIILKNAPLKLYKTLRLLFKLVLKGVFPLKPTHRSKLRKWAPFIRENAKGKHGDVKRRVSQNGKGLGDILKTVLPLIGPIISLMI